MSLCNLQLLPAKKKMFAFAVITVLSVVWTGVVEGKCCMPNQWEGNENTFVGSHTSSQDSLILRMMQVSYDATRMMIAVNVTSFVNEVPQPKVQVLFDYKQQTEYIWDDTNCNKTKYTTPFPSPCLPDTAKEVGKSYFGAGTNVLDFITYMIPSSDGTVVVASFTKHCIPVGETVYNVKSANAYLMSVGYDGITVGIKDPSVFNLPAICNKQFYSEDVLHHLRHIRRKNVFGF